MRVAQAIIIFSIVGIAPSYALDKIYWTQTTGGIFRSDFDGGNVELVISSPSLGLAIDEAGGKIYYSIVPNDEIRRADLDGMNVETLVTGLTTGTQHMALDLVNQKLYWIDSFNQKISRSNLDGTTQEDIVTSLNFAIGIALNPGQGKLYWTEGGPDVIRNANLDGSNIQTIYTSPTANAPLCLALDAEIGKLYWTEQKTTDNLLRSNLDGTNVEVLGSYTNPQDVALNFRRASPYIRRGRVYVTDFTAIGAPDQIKSSRLDGNGIEPVVMAPAVVIRFVGSGLPASLPLSESGTVAIITMVMLYLGISRVRSRLGNPHSPV